ncbi:hypothetical protein L1049_028384 [Liquidambar formosana]|uniref:Uncharacterized protein n=1 Tax=Liquidambar formosana TaxID=63359 RepID=A0AAP0RJK8_LIQFO
MTSEDRSLRLKSKKRDNVIAVTKGRSVVVESRGLNASNDVELAIKRSDFPSDFLFGASTSAVQIEGSATKGGRGPSVWDCFTREFPEKIADRSDINKSIDSYKRYKKDVKALNNLGVDSYRFSISWTRILPNGSLTGGINQEGIDHYNNLINELMKQGIKPFVTLFHFDSPQALQDKYGGFLSRSIVNDFKDYCEICFKFFGDRVKHWITINEPLMIAQFGYDMGFAAPGRCSQSIGGCVAGNSSSEPYIVSHNMLLAHAAAARLYKKRFQAKQGGEIGISLVGQYFEPYSESPEDVAAVGRALDFYLGWYMDPLVNGDYPRSMRNLVKNRLPTFTKAEKKMVKGSCDFIGINYYTSRYVKSLPIDPHALPVSFTCDSFTDLKELLGDGIFSTFFKLQAEGSAFLYIYPHGLQKLLEYMKEKYQSPKIYITENGGLLIFEWWENNEGVGSRDTAKSDAEEKELKEGIAADIFI